MIQEIFKLYDMQCFAGCIPLLYAIGRFVDRCWIVKGYLKQNHTKFMDVYKIVPGLKGHEIKSLWHKSKIACELNVYFAELGSP